MVRKRKKNLEMLGLLLALVGVVTSIVSCAPDRLDVDVSGIEVAVEVRRFDVAVASLDKADPGAGSIAVFQEYGSFAELYNTNIIKVGSMYRSDYLEKLKLFLNYELNDDINKEIARVYGHGNLAFVPQLTEAFKHYRYYYPRESLPVVYAFNGGFNQSVVVDSGLVGIGLEKYLGASCPLYRKLEMEAFRKCQMIPGRIVPDCMQAIARSQFAFGFTSENLLSSILHEGRIMYFVKAMIPSINDTLLWGFSTAQMTFCDKYEKSMWSYLIDNKLLFDTDYMNIHRFTSDGPFTSAFSKESPSRAASWLGYRIVEQYLKRETSVTLQELMSETDFQKIMNKSKYNP